MFGKVFASMFTGSLYGAGAIKFAMMSYVIANMQPDRKIGGMQVELNPRLLADILGERMEDVEAAIEFLCSPDPDSRTEGEEGRRLVRLGQFDFKVVNGAKYRAIRDEEARREQNRNSQERFRNKKKAAKKAGSVPLAGERGYVKALEAGASEGELARLAAQGLPGVVETEAFGFPEGGKKELISVERQAPASIPEIAPAPNAATFIPVPDQAETGLVIDHQFGSSVSDREVFELELAKRLSKPDQPKIVRPYP